MSNKVAYASFEDAKAFRKRKEGLVASRFNVDEIELRVLNGDGEAVFLKRMELKASAYWISSIETKRLPNA